jgi:hypothetical protein
VLVIPCVPLLIWSDYLVLKSFPSPSYDDDDDDDDNNDEEEDDSNNDDNKFIVEFTYIVMLYSN